MLLLKNFSLEANMMLQSVKIILTPFPSLHNSCRLVLRYFRYFPGRTLWPDPALCKLLQIFMKFYVLLKCLLLVCSADQAPGADWRPPDRFCRISCPDTVRVSGLQCQSELAVSAGRCGQNSPSQIFDITTRICFCQHQNCCINEQLQLGLSIWLAHAPVE